MDKGIATQGVFARTTVPASKFSLRPVQAWVVEFARLVGMRDDDAVKIELLVEEAFMSVVQSAFQEDERGEIAVLLEKRPGQLVIALEDHGLPVDLDHLEQNEELALNLILLRQLVEGFTFINRGKEGKRLELIKNIPAESVAAAFEDRETMASEAAIDVILGEPRFRMLNAGETLSLAQLAYRSYGYTYVSDYYYPDRVREKIEHGLMETCVAVSEAGLVIGSLSLFYERNDSKVAECGAAMVDPRYRGMNMFKQMKLFLFDHATRKGLYGIFSEAVTIHPFTQQGNHSLGARETGLLLSYVSESITFKKIGSESAGQRQALVLFYARLNPEPMRTVYAPPVYADLVRQLYAENRMNRQVEEVTDTLLPSGEDSRIEIQIRQDAFNDATIELSRIGGDALIMILHHVRQLCERKVEAIYLNLPMGDRDAAILAGLLADKGFLFAGFIPELKDGDVLKLQYLNNVLFDASKVTVVSPMARELLARISAQYASRP